MLFPFHLLGWWLSLLLEDSYSIFPPPRSLPTCICTCIYCLPQVVLLFLNKGGSSICLLDSTSFYLLISSNIIFPCPVTSMPSTYKDAWVVTIKNNSLLVLLSSLDPPASTPFFDAFIKIFRIHVLSPSAPILSSLCFHFFFQILSLYLSSHYQGH